MITLVFATAISDINENEYYIGIAQKAYRYVVRLAVATMIIFVAVPSRDDMKRLIGIEIAARVANSERAQKIAADAMDALEKFARELNK
jgi:hypothetical protein